jgi:hypothetical protein
MAAAAPPARIPAASHAGPRGRDQPRRERRPAPPPIPAREAPAATGDPSAAATADDAADADQTDAGDQVAPVSEATSPLADGRSPGDLARQPPTRSRSSLGRSPSSAGLLTSRYMSSALDPTPNGPCPVAAYTSTAPRLKMSLGGPTSCPRACSGDKNPGEVKSGPDRPVPKPITRGPSSPSSTFDGSRFRCTSPASWMARSPSASPEARASTVRGGNGPRARTASASDGPGTYAVASHGASPSRSAAITGAVNLPSTWRAAAISVRNAGSPAIAGATGRTTTRSPSGAMPRYSPPSPSGSSSWYGPIMRGRSDVSGTATMNPHS